MDDKPYELIPEELRRGGEGEPIRINLDQPIAEVCKELSKYPVATRVQLNGTIVVARDIAQAKLKERLDKPFWHTRKHVSHYTNIDALLCILNDKKLKFSSFKDTNDRLEYKLINEETNKKRIFCVMGSSEENFGMWSMYGGLAAKPTETEKLN